MNRRNPVILCVDDERTNRSLLEFILVPRGFKVVSASDGKEALQILDGMAIDLVLLDIVMPFMDGFEVCRRIKASEELHSIPVIMITASCDKRDRIKGIVAGAEEFISKPFDPDEVLARIKMLLKVKELGDKLSYAYNHIARLTAFGEQMLSGFDPDNFDFMEKIDQMVDQITRKSFSLDDIPQVVVVGFMEQGDCRWYRYDVQYRKVVRRTIDLPLDVKQVFTESKSPVMAFYNESEADSNVSAFVAELEKNLVPVSNMVKYSSDGFCIIAVNYERDVTSHNAEVLNSVVMQSLFLKSLAAQVKDTESAFDYMVFALARASEANDEDTGAHVMRVGDFCAVLARQLGMPENFVKAIRIQASLHDVGKIHVAPAILKKPGELTAEEWNQMVQHTIYGSKIIGGHRRMQMGAHIAIAHHERWDGSGYPYGLRGEEIPLEARIMNISDQYDALRNPRVYKKFFDHNTAVEIIAKGDGRTMPTHFDPKILKVFLESSDELDEIYKASLKNGYRY